MRKLSTLIRRVTGKKRLCSAVILSAGNGSRFDHDKAKQFVKICGVPVLVRSVLAFSETRLFDEIIVVSRQEDVSSTINLLNQYGIGEKVKVVPGGDTRQKSSLAGFNAISSKSEFVAIHDAARCLITSNMIDCVMELAFINGAAACASRVADTLKRTDKNNVITETVDRENIWAVQTPQVFRTDLYCTASAIAERDGFIATDDCMLCEKIGYKVKLVDCGHTNIKITYPDDVTVAEAIITSRKKEDYKQ